MTCRHMYEEKPSGMCFVCQPDMFPTLKELDAGRRWMAEWNEYAGNKKYRDPRAISLVRQLLVQRAEEHGVPVPELAAEYRDLLEARVAAARRFA